MERASVYGESTLSVRARRWLLYTIGLILSALFGDGIEIPKGNTLNLLTDNKPLSDLKEKPLYFCEPPLTGDCYFFAEALLFKSENTHLALRCTGNSHVT